MKLTLRLKWAAARTGAGRLERRSPRRLDGFDREFSPDESIGVNAQK